MKMIKFNDKQGNRLSKVEDIFRTLKAFALLVLLLTGNVATASTFLLEQGKWNAIVFPVNSSSLTFRELLADDLPATEFGTSWIVYSYSQLGGYSQPSIDDAIKIGHGYWILQLTGSDVQLDVPSIGPLLNPIDEAHCLSPLGCWEIPLDVSVSPVAWSLRGVPSPTHESANALLAVSGAGTNCETGCTLTQAANDGRLYIPFYQWNPTTEEYDFLNSNQTWVPWRAFWVAAIQTQADDPLALVLRSTRPTSEITTLSSFQASTVIQGFAKGLANLQRVELEIYNRDTDLFFNGTGWQAGRVRVEAAWTSTNSGNDKQWYLSLNQPTNEFWGGMWDIRSFAIDTQSTEQTIPGTAVYHVEGYLPVPELQVSQGAHDTVISYHFTANQHVDQYEYLLRRSEEAGAIGSANAEITFNGSGLKEFSAFDRWNGITHEGLINDKLYYYTLQVCFEGARDRCVSGEQVSGFASANVAEDMAIDILATELGQLPLPSSDPGCTDRAICVSLSLFKQGHLWAKRELNVAFSFDQEQLIIQSVRESVTAGEERRNTLHSRLLSLSAANRFRCDSMQTRDECFDNLRTNMLTVANSWSRFGGLSFVQSDNLGPMNGWKTGDLNMTFFDTGNWSYLGTGAANRSGEAGSVGLGSINIFNLEADTITHEFGHALGFQHEHIGPDTPVEFDRAAAEEWWYKTQTLPREVRRLGGGSTLMNVAEMEEFVGPAILPQLVQIANDKVDHNIMRTIDRHLPGVLASEFDPTSIMMYNIHRSWLVDPFDPDCTESEDNMVYCIRRGQTLSTVDKIGMSVAYPKQREDSISSDAPSTWGRWLQPEFCEEGSAINALRMLTSTPAEADQEGVVAIEMRCTNTDDGTETSTILTGAQTSPQPANTSWQSWHQCAANSFARGFNVKSAAAGGDDRGVQDMQLICDDLSSIGGMIGSATGQFSTGSLCANNETASGVTSRFDGDAWMVDESIIGLQQPSWAEYSDLLSIAGNREAYVRVPERYRQMAVNGHGKIKIDSHYIDTNESDAGSCGFLWLSDETRYNSDRYSLSVSFLKEDGTVIPLGDSLDFLVTQGARTVCEEGFQSSHSGPRLCGSTSCVGKGVDDLFASTHPDWQWTVFADENSILGHAWPNDNAGVTDVRLMCSL